MLQFISNAARLRAALLRRSAMVGYGLALAGALLFSTKTIVIKLAYAAGADAETMQALRMVIALPIYLTIGLHWILTHGGDSERPPRGAALLSAAMVGLLGYYVSSYLDLKGLESVSAQLERLILFTYPFFVVIFGAIFSVSRSAAQLSSPLASATRVSG
jgi:drug/metabolite transporter (DMT)-like permease